MTAKKDGRLIARAFVSTPTLAPLQGSIAAALVSPDVKQVGVFKAGFLVVTSLEHPYNNLGDLQRAKWSPSAASLLGTLDIGCAACPPSCSMLEYTTTPERERYFFCHVA